MGKTVFISRSVPDTDLLRVKLFDHGLQLIDQPLISLTAVDFDPDQPGFDWIFFSSGNAVRFFYSRHPNTGNARLAAIGEGTARILSVFGSCAFTGESTDTLLTAASFARIADGCRVLFPGSSQSLRTIQKALRPHLVTDLVCYETKELPKSVGYHDVLVFTSPANVRSYLQNNAITRLQKVIVFGQSTGKELTSHGYPDFVIPPDLSAEELANAIITAANS